MLKVSQLGANSISCVQNICISNASTSNPPPVCSTGWVDNNWTNLSTAFTSQVEVLNQLEATVIPQQYTKILQQLNHSMIRN